MRYHDWIQFHNQHQFDFENVNELKQRSVFHDVLLDIPHSKLNVVNEVKMEVEEDRLLMEEEDDCLRYLNCES